MYLFCVFFFGEYRFLKAVHCPWVTSRVCWRARATNDPVFGRRRAITQRRLRLRASFHIHVPHIYIFLSFSFTHTTIRPYVFHTAYVLYTHTHITHTVKIPAAIYVACAPARHLRSAHKLVAKIQIYYMSYTYIRVYARNSCCAIVRLFYGPYTFMNLCEQPSVFLFQILSRRLQYCILKSGFLPVKKKKKESRNI